MIQDDFFPDFSALQANIGWLFICKDRISEFRFLRTFWIFKTGCLSTTQRNNTRLPKKIVEWSILAYNFILTFCSCSTTYFHLRNYNAPSCFKYFSELALTLAGGFMLSDFLKFAIAFFLSPFIA